MLARRALYIAVVAALLALAGCGGTRTTTVVTTVTKSGASSTPSITSTPASSPTTTIPTTATTSSADSLASRCRGAGLALSFLGGQGATGHGELGFALRNTSSHACVTGGYPGVLFLDKAGRPLPTVPDHTTQDFFGSAPVRQLTVAPGKTVSFRLGVTHGVASTAGCRMAYGLQAIAPGDTATLRTPIANGGAYECRTATVSPLQPGDSAYQAG